MTLQYAQMSLTLNWNQSVMQVKCNITINDADNELRNCADFINDEDDDYQSESLPNLQVDKVLYAEPDIGQFVKQLKVKRSEQKRRPKVNDNYGGSNTLSVIGQGGLGELAKTMWFIPCKVCHKAARVGKC